MGTQLVLCAQQPGDGAWPQPPCGQGSGTRQEGDLAVLSLPCVMLGWMTSSAVEIKDSTCAVGSSSEFCPAILKISCSLSAHRPCSAGESCQGQQKVASCFRLLAWGCHSKGQIAVTPTPSFPGRFAHHSEITRVWRGGNKCT